MSAQHTPRRVGSYARAIEWIAVEDDTQWIDDENGSPSVTLCLVADVFGRTVEEATADLRAAIAKATGSECACGRTPQNYVCRHCKATGSAA